MTNFDSDRKKRRFKTLRGSKPQGSIRTERGRWLRCHSVLFCAAIPFAAVSSASASNWIGGADNSYFDDSDNWGGGVPSISSDATFGQPAGVEFRASGAASQLSVNKSTSFLLNGRTFQAGSTTISGGAALMIQGGLASLGNLTAEGGLVATGVGTLVMADNISGGSSTSHILQFSNGASLQAGAINILGRMSLQFQSGAIGAANSLALNSEQSLTVTGGGSSFSIGSLSSVGLVTVTDGASVALGGSGSNFENLSVSGVGSRVSGLYSSTGRSISVTNGAALSLGGFQFLGGGQLTLSGTGSTANIQNISWDSSTGGSITISDGASMTTQSTSSSLNSLSVSGYGSSFTSTGALYLQGNLAIESGATVSVNGVSNLSFGQTLTISGTGSSFSTGSLSSVGGFVSITDGASMALGGSTSNFENLSVSGVGSGASASASSSSSGRYISVSNGATLTLGSFQFLSNGQLTLSGTSSTANIQNISWDSSSRGSITISDGASMITQAGSSYLNSLSISGIGSNYTSASNVIDIQGSLSLDSGAALTVGNLNLAGAASMRDAIVSASNIQNSAVLEIRGGSVGTSVDGGVLGNSSAGSLTGSFSTNYQLQNQGSVTVSAGDSMSFRQGSNSGGANMKVGGSMEFLQTFENDGTVALSGDFRANSGIQNRSTVEISGTANIWGGDFVNNGNGSVAVFAQSTANFMDDVSNDGTIAVGPGSTVVFHGAYSGYGSITGPGTTMMLGDLRPGHSPGRQTFEGDLVLGDLSSYQVEIAGLAQGSQYDVIDVGGDLILNGGLSISLLNGFIPSIGDSFEILSFGSVEGGFTGYSGLALDDGLSFQPVWSQHNLVLTVVPEPGTTMLLIPGFIGLVVLLRRCRVSVH